MAAKSAKNQYAALLLQYASNITTKNYRELQRTTNPRQPRFYMWISGHSPGTLRIFLWYSSPFFNCVLATDNLRDYLLQHRYWDKETIKVRLQINIWRYLGFVEVVVLVRCITMEVSLCCPGRAKETGLANVSSCNLCRVYAPLRVSDGNRVTVDI